MWEDPASGAESPPVCSRVLYPSRARPERFKPVTSLGRQSITHDAITDSAGVSKYGDLG